MSCFHKHNKNVLESENKVQYQVNKAIARFFCNVIHLDN